MNNFTKSLMVAAVAMALAPAAEAGRATAGLGIQWSHHNFSGANPASTKVNKFLATQQDENGVADATNDAVGLCSYCHTPHGALQTALLWNHTLSGNTFSWDEATTAAGTSYATLDNTYKGPSIKCLSCHDGSVAIGDVANYKEGGKNGAAAMNTFKISGVVGEAQIATAAGSLAGNHPIGMPYPFGQKTSTYNLISSGANTLYTQFVADPTLKVGGTKIKLFNQTGTQAPVGGAVAGISGIECASCHDVHNKDATDDLLLRGNINGTVAADGYICVQCHIK